ncbi:hypothetical protein F5Y16DRAFT_389745 [Xylariaceae sp. FL0255]|nr:hypothetical protein F5Y16DRAFT_389745 [Xylariaceae sp. FL0255]
MVWLKFLFSALPASVIRPMNALPSREEHHFLINHVEKGDALSSSLSHTLCGPLPCRMSQYLRLLLWHTHDTTPEDRRYVLATWVPCLSS